MKRYYNSALLSFSTVGGIVTALILSFIVEDIPTIALFSSLTILGISITVPAMFAIADRKFKPIIKEIKDDIVIDERVHYIVGQELKHGFIMTTKNSLFVISTENDKPIKLEIKKSDIKKISISDGIYLNIFLGYDKCIRVFAGNCDELSKKLIAEGFGK